MHESNDNGRYAERLMCGSGDIVEMISGVVESVTAQSQHQGETGER